MELNREQVAILNHTAHGAARGFYCGDSPDMQKLVEAGLMVSAGHKSFVPDEYFRMTAKGSEWLADVAGVKGANDEMDKTNMGQNVL